MLSVFLCVAGVSAADIDNSTDLTAADDAVALESSDDVKLNVDEGHTGDGDVLASGNSSNKEANKSISVSAITPSKSVYIFNSSFTIKILDDNGAPVKGKNVQVKVNNIVSNLTTNKKGQVSFKVTEKGTYAVSYVFKNDGYTTVKGSKQITVVANSKSKIKGSNYVAYVGASNPYSVTLTTGGVIMPYKKVVFKIKGKTYNLRTDSKGKATLDIHLGKGTYKIAYSYKGQYNAKSASGSSKITVKKGMPTKVIRMNSLTYRHKTPAPLIFKYKDVRGNAIPFKTIVLEIGKQSYFKKTNRDGLVTFTIKKSMGSYKMTAYSYNTDVYKSSHNSFTLNVKQDNSKNINGFWLFGADMNNVNLEAVAKSGLNQIFLNEYAITLHGKTAVSEFATQAKSLGINVHIWVQAFYKGGWISPLTSDGKYNYSLFNSIINDAKEYASIKGVAGIHFDYLRFPGTAYMHANGVNAINYFTKTACDAIHKMDSSLIVSAAIMPEPSSMKYYYGQDIPEMSKHLDWIVPMAYKGNYNQNSAWIKSVTKQFVGQSKGALVLTGLQGYSSDGNVKKLSSSSLMKDASSAVSGGARGVIVFRYSLFNLINFKDI